MKRNIKLIFISIIFTFFCLCLLEFLGRCYFYRKHNFSYKESFLYEGDDILGYKISPKYKGRQGRYCSGMRNDHFDLNKGSKIRIICLGESTTFGHAQLENSKVWPQILEDFLNSSESKDYEVFNAGVCGYGSSNLAARLKTDILKLKPDMIIFFAGWNLVGCLKSQYSWVPENVVLKTHPAVIKINNFLVNNSVVYLKMKNIVKVLLKKKNELLVDNRLDTVYGGELPVFGDDLREMVSICKQNNITPIFVKYPSRDYSLKRYADTINIVEGICRENDVYLVDCASYFKSLDYPLRAEYFLDIAHLTDKGNEKIAQIIYSFLVSEGLVR